MSVVMFLFCRAALFFCENLCPSFALGMIYAATSEWLVLFTRNTRPRQILQSQKTRQKDDKEDTDDDRNYANYPSAGIGLVV